MASSLVLARQLVAQSFLPVLLVQPSRTARLNPMDRAVQAIPTFGTMLTSDGLEGNGIRPHIPMRHLIGLDQVRPKVGLVGISLGHGPGGTALRTAADQLGTIGKRHHV
jgi:hypothetical protein